MGDRIFSKYISFPLSALSHQCLILFLICRLLVPERQMNKAWETSTSSALSDVKECQIQKYFETKKPLFIVTSQYTVDKMIENFSFEFAFIYIL
jgi:hypothetical protein